MKKWSSDAIETMRGEFECTDWSAMRESCASIDEYTDVVTSYVAFVQEKNATTKIVKKFPNDKPWFTSFLKQLRREKTAAYVSGDKETYKVAKSCFPTCSSTYFKTVSAVSLEVNSRSTVVVIVSIWTMTFHSFT